MSRPARTRKPHYNEIHALPLPLTVYPLPAFIPHNPLSVLRVIWTSISSLWSRACSHPRILYKAYLSIDSQSVHVTDPAAIRALWTSGFFGKGSLSRSEPNWLEGEKSRRGIAAAQTSEQLTRKRREERKEFKFDRARKEREIIERQLQNEGKLAHLDATATTHPKSAQQAQAELLDSGTLTLSNEADKMISRKAVHFADKPPRDGDATCLKQSDGHSHTEFGMEGTTEVTHLAPATEQLSSDQQGQVEWENSKTISSPPPEHNHQDQLLNQEHLQLALEEAFFLVYGIGVLEIWGHDRSSPLSNLFLFRLFRQWSRFPPTPSTTLQTDDPFLISYVVYHHFRSLGWVVRPGVKFAVDFLLYNRGPVFAHAEFAVVIMPSYNDDHGPMASYAIRGSTKTQRNPWEWLHCVNRVQSQVRKNLVLVFVEVPDPTYDNQDANGDIGDLLNRFKVREVNVKRWIPNRTRD